MSQKVAAKFIEQYKKLFFVLIYEYLYVICG